MIEITIPCGEMTHIAQFHEALGQALNFPASYGANLDAMHDLLTSLSSPTRLVLAGLGSADFPILALQRVLRDSEEENPNLTVSW